MKTNTAALLVSLLLAGFVAQAEENQQSNTSSAKMTDVQKKDEKVKDIDEEITNARMRATLGSKSKWSFKSSLGYSGATVKAPGDRVRPEIQSGPDAPELTSIDGSIGVNYRLNPADSLYFSTGISIQEPFHGAVSDSSVINPSGTKENKVQIATPGLTFSRAYKAAGMQNISSLTYSHATTDYAVNTKKQVGSVGVNQTILADLGESSWAGGLALSATYYIYSADAKNQYDLAYGAYPFAEYAFNDTYSFRTVFGYFNMYHMKASSSSDDQGSVISAAPYQSMGIGISVTRDIYVYPNVQFIPFDIRDDRTNVAISTNISLF